MWLQIALRNLSRNLRRTLLTLGVIALGTAMSFAVAGYIDDALGKLRVETVSQFGNFQIAHPQFWSDRIGGIQSMIDEEMYDDVQEVFASYNAVSGSSPEILLSAIAIGGGSSKGLRALGFEPGNEALNYNNIVIGEDPGIDSESASGILIGESLSKEFGVGIGDRVKLRGSTITGQANQVQLRIDGIFRRNDESDEAQLVFIPNAAAKKFLNLQTESFSKIVVTLNDIEATDSSAVDIQKDLDALAVKLTEEARADALSESQAAIVAFETAQTENPDPEAVAPELISDDELAAISVAALEVRSWKELSTYYQQVEGFFSALFGFLTIAVALLVFFIVFQVLTMSFLERTREVGTIRAIGTKRQQIFSMFIIESVLLGVLGGLVGIAGGWLLGQGFNTLDIGWLPPGAIRPVPVELSLTLANAWVPLLISAVATLISALYPSIHSARLQIVDALRTT
jgi:putative ABC transport system permease protein